MTPVNSSSFGRIGALVRFSIVLNRDVLVEDSQIGWNERFCAG
jgi:hypothetical protein